MQDEERNDVYLSVYALGSWPINNGVFFQTGTVPDAKISVGAGAGLKVAVFPSIAKGFVGVELESIGQSTDISLPLTTGPGTGAVGRVNLWAFNSMVNLIVRYPHLPMMIPYGGVGGGISSGVLTHADIPGRPDKDFESSSTFGYQFLAGVQSNWSKKVFVFGEYKYLAANYHWQRMSLDFRSHYGLIGVGLRF